MAATEEAQRDGVDPEFAALVHSYAQAVDEGRMADAQEASAAVMTEALRQAQENPTPDLLRSLIAGKAENEGEWEVARRIFQEQLDEATKLPDPAIRGCCQSRPLLDLARISRWEGKHEQAYELAKSAVESSRVRDWGFHIAWTLAPFSTYALRTGRVDEALQAADEGLSLLGDGRAQDLFRAQLMLRRGESLLHSGRDSDARLTLNHAWEKIEPFSGMSDATGVQATIADWWQLEAKLRSKQGDWPQARQAWESAVAFAHHVIETWGSFELRPAVALAEVLAEYADAAAAAGESPRATALRAERASIQSMAPRCEALQ